VATTLRGAETVPTSGPPISARNTGNDGTGGGTVTVKAPPAPVVAVRPVALKRPAPGAPKMSPRRSSIGTPVRGSSRTILPRWTTLRVSVPDSVTGWVARTNAARPCVPGGGLSVTVGANGRGSAPNGSAEARTTRHGFAAPQSPPRRKGLGTSR